jgi:D-alanyl-D-alanine carboxypeptidase/D-alanyl-D-alanine-endopeptidase (penicillin-binding protein 4)
VRERYAPGIPDSWEIDDLPYRYAAPVAAFSVDRSAFELRAVGGEPKLEPKDFGVFCYRRTTTGAPEIRYDPIRRTLEVDGALPPKDERLELLSVPSADGAAAAYLGARMVAADSVPDRVPDAEIKGSNLGEILKACLPPSDNNIAENLLLMGATSDGKPSANPYSAARKMETQFLISEVGLDPGDIHVYDGSGLSRHDFVTARAIIKLLCWARSQPTGDLWVNCLAVPGKGTLGHRLAGISFAGKTGSSDMISALSGYLTSANGKRYCVSIVMNGFGCPASVARSVQDAIVEEVSRGAL